MPHFSRPSCRHREGEANFCLACLPRTLLRLIQGPRLGVGERFCQCAIFEWKPCSSFLPVRSRISRAASCLAFRATTLSARTDLPLIMNPPSHFGVDAVKHRGRGSGPARQRPAPDPCAEFESFVAVPMCKPGPSTANPRLARSSAGLRALCRCQTSPSRFRCTR